MVAFYTVTLICIVSEYVLLIIYNNALKDRLHCNRMDIISLCLTIEGSIEFSVFLN